MVIIKTEFKNENMAIMFYSKYLNLIKKEYPKQLEQGLISLDLDDKILTMEVNDIEASKDLKKDFNSLKMKVFKKISGIKITLIESDKK